MVRRRYHNADSRYLKQFSYYLSSFVDAKLASSKWRACKEVAFIKEGLKAARAKEKAAFGGLFGKVQRTLVPMWSTVPCATIDLM